MSDTNYKSPIYVQLRDLLRSKIENGEYPPGTTIPPEGQLAEMYGVNRLSVISAVQALEKEGLVMSVQGSGVFVKGPRVIRNLDTFSGYRHTMTESGKDTSTRILVKALRQAGPYYSQIFGIPEDENIWYIQRVDSQEGIASALEEIYIPCGIIPNMEDLDIRRFSIYDAYCWNGHQPATCKQWLMIAGVDKTRANFMDIDENMPVLQFAYLTKDAKGEIIEFARNYVRGDSTEFTVNYHG